MQCPVHFVWAEAKRCGGQQGLAADPQSGLLAATVIDLAQEWLRQRIDFRQHRFVEESVNETAIDNVWRDNLPIKFCQNSYSSKGPSVQIPIAGSYSILKIDCLTFKHP